MDPEELIYEMFDLLQERDMPAYPIAAKSAGVGYTDYLTGAHDAGPFNVSPDKDYVYTPSRNRQCSIGYHDECTDPSGEACGCVCHKLAEIIRRACAGCETEVAPEAGSVDTARASSEAQRS